MKHDHHDHHESHVQPEENTWEYVKFGFVIASIVAVSVWLTYVSAWSIELLATNFMAVFMVVFASFKFAALEMFAITYSGYDVIARKFRAWGYVFPFVEAGLGLGYFPFGNVAALNLMTMLVTATASIGVVRELRRKSTFQCACLGTIIKLPLSKISFLEDFLMLGMAASMLLV